MGHTEIEFYLKSHSYKVDKRFTLFAPRSSAGCLSESVSVWISLSKLRADLNGREMVEAIKM
jgi:hypothetical protein